MPRGYLREFLTCSSLLDMEKEEGWLVLVVVRGR